MKKFYLICLRLTKKHFVTAISLFIFINISFSQNIGVKTNLVYWSTTTPNIGVELALSNKKSIDIVTGLNTFTFNNNRKLKHLIIQPDIRYWFCETFNGHFLGLHAHWAQYNVSGIDIPFGRLETLKDNRYQGYLYGGGLSYGYQWPINKRLNLEVNVGAGYAHIKYDKYPCRECGAKINEGNYNYFGVTKTALSLIYFIN